ncbi:MAG: glycosyltransferase family 4 protein [Saprospiraceae bacterium]|nr:glycosyltransferase family 4 protein [Saprospiraceae bacterium]
MKIAVIVPSLTERAPVQVAMTVAVQLARGGHTVTVYYFKSTSGLWHAEGIVFVKISFFSRIDWDEYDIIHSHGFFPDAFVSLRKSRHSRAKSVSTIHNYVFPELKLLYNQVVSLTFGWSWVSFWKRMDHMVVLTNDALQYYRTLLPQKSISRIYNGKNIVPDPNVILPQHRLLVEEIRKNYTYCIGSIAALISRKRIDILIRHLSRVETGGLMILGEGPQRKQLEELVAQHHLQDRVKFLGYIPQAHVYLELFDISAHPSMSEGFSLSLIEAAGYQKKIVCADIPSFCEAFTDDEATFFNSHDELTIDQAILEAWRDNEKPKKAYQKAVTSYSEERMGEEHEVLFERLISLNPPALLPPALLPPS